MVLAAVAEPAETVVEAFVAILVVRNSVAELFSAVGNCEVVVVAACATDARTRTSVVDKKYLGSVGTIGVFRQIRPRTGTTSGSEAVAHETVWERVLF